MLGLLSIFQKTLCSWRMSIDSQIVNKNIIHYQFHIPWLDDLINFIVLPLFQRLILEMNTIKSKRELVMNWKQLLKWGVTFFNWMVMPLTFLKHITFIWMMYLNLLWKKLSLLTLSIFLTTTRIQGSILVICKKYFILWESKVLS